MRGHRREMLDAAVGFILQAVQVPGVRRVSLVGSITTPKADPKDIDLLLVIDDDADVPRLAGHARALRGRLQGLNRGADCLLADPRGRYLGRTCPWKECAPGRRSACQALHCGRRSHLSDDLKVLNLRQDVVSSPAVTLWPEIVRRVRLPDDVENAIGKLQEALGPGLKRGLDELVEIVAHRAEWAAQFGAESARLREALGPAFTLEHAGSTAVPGLDAKPVVDILAGTAEPLDIKRLARILEPLGYESLGEAGVPGRLLFTARGSEWFNVHAVALRGPHWENALALRDYLRAHPLDAEA